MVFTSRTRAVVEIPFRTVFVVVREARMLAAKRRIPIERAGKAFLYIIAIKIYKHFGIYIFFIMINKVFFIVKKLILKNP